MKAKQRLVGLDLFRGLAVLAVVILHADEGVANPGTIWKQIINFSEFAVPFFLATSFYLACQKLHSSLKPYRLKPRLQRLLIPYFVWTFIYLAYKSSKYLLVQETGNFQKLFADPFGLLFLGGAAFHLYFLPLLVTGTVFVKLAEFLFRKKIKTQYLFLLGIVSIGLYELILMSNNSFQLGANIAFQGLNESFYLGINTQPILRIFLVFLAWTIRCLPYIFIAMLLSENIGNWKAKIFQRNSTVILFILFIMINIFAPLIPFPGFEELSRGFVTLLFALSLSNYIQENRWIFNLSLCSFGIYLIHLLFVESLKIIGNRIPVISLNQESFFALLGITFISFFMSWFITSILVQKKSISKLIFGN